LPRRGQGRRHRRLRDQADEHPSRRSAGRRLEGHPRRALRHGGRLGREHDRRAAIDVHARLPVAARGLPRTLTIARPGQPMDDAEAGIDQRRRELFKRTLFGAGYVGLKALATGLPISLFTRSVEAWAQDASDTSAAPTCVDATKAQYLILSTSSLGDPVNA